MENVKQVEAVKAPMLPVSWKSAEFVGKFHSQKVAAGFALKSQGMKPYVRKDGKSIETVELVYAKDGKASAYCVTPFRMWAQK